MQDADQLLNSDMKPLRTVEHHEALQAKYEELLRTATKKRARALVVKYSHQVGQNATFGWRWMNVFIQVIAFMHILVLFCAQN